MESGGAAIPEFSPNGKTEKNGTKKINPFAFDVNSELTSSKKSKLNMSGSSSSSIDAIINMVNEGDSSVKKHEPNNYSKTGT